MDATATPESKAHYAYATRRMLHLHGDGRLPDVVAIDVEPDYGYITRLTYRDGAFRITSGNDLGVDAASSVELARDKGHTKFLLRRLGIDHPQGREFLLPWWADSIRPSHERRGNPALVTAASAASYVEDELSYPVYVKPVAGTKGEGVRRVESAVGLEHALHELEQARARAAVVEESIDLPDYRIVTFDGELVCAYRRVPLHVVGDGASRLDDLIDALQRRLHHAGRDVAVNGSDPRIASRLDAMGLDLATVLGSGEVITLTDVSNLAAGGTAEDVADRIHPRWIELAAGIASAFDLRLCGTDLACADIASDTSEHCVLEVNATPGLEHFAASGVEQHALVDAFYQRVLSTST